MDTFPTVNTTSSSTSKKLFLEIDIGARRIHKPQLCSTLLITFILIGWRCYKSQLQLDKFTLSGHTSIVGFVPGQGGRRRAEERLASPFESFCNGWQRLKSATQTRYFPLSARISLGVNDMHPENGERDGTTKINAPQSLKPSQLTSLLKIIHRSFLFRSSHGSTVNIRFSIVGIPSPRLESHLRLIQKLW